MGAGNGEDDVEIGDRQVQVGLTIGKPPGRARCFPALWAVPASRQLL